MFVRGVCSTHRFNPFDSSVTMKELTLYETRVIGVLIEKSLTTPDQYPLSINALTNACNQKSNRDPVLELAESTVKNTVDDLLEQGLVVEVLGSGSRVAKYKHRFCNTEFSEYKFTPQSLAIVCVLFLRGVQTPGELRTRGQRLYEFKEVQEVEIALHKLMTEFATPVVEKLEREPGRRESRYRHLFGGDQPAEPKTLSIRVPEPPDEDLLQQVQALEMRVKVLEEGLDSIQDLLDELTR